MPVRNIIVIAWSLLIIRGMNIRVKHSVTMINNRRNSIVVTATSVPPAAINSVVVIAVTAPV